MGVSRFRSVLTGVEHDFHLNHHLNYDTVSRARYGLTGLGTGMNLRPLLELAEELFLDEFFADGIVGRFIMFAQKWATLI